MRRRQWFVVAISTALAFPKWLIAGSHRSHCEGCGCACAPQKVCRMVCETKKVPRTTYSGQQEDFCIPGPSERVRCPDGSAGRESCGDEPYNKKRNWLWFPQCAEVKTRTKLVKTVTEKEEVTVRWVVEYLCPDCRSAHAVPPTPAAP
ncbi:MAG: hypothetical protein Q8K78_10125 [Planctomycetaceae bacterium]|nr:hypothetical protein [Planctomycetaceae bacterium]